MHLVDRELLKEAIKQAGKDEVAAVTDFINNHRDTLLGLPVAAVHDLFEAAGADDTFATTQEDLFRAMGTAERDDFMRRALAQTRKSRELVTRQLVLLRDANAYLSDTAQRVFTTLLGALL